MDGALRALTAVVPVSMGMPPWFCDLPIDEQSALILLLQPTGEGDPVESVAKTADTHRRADLREFLMIRRARISPAEAGLPDGGARRRTPGLRREEVAVLAGVGVSWYQWLQRYTP